jgi:hypothetical protein
VIPQLVRLKVHSGERQRIGLWIPLLPLYIVGLPFLILTLLALAAACAYYRVNPARMVIAGWLLLAGLRGMRFELNQDDEHVLVNII